MAYTVTRTPTVFGNEATVLIKLVADASTQTVETGLKRILHIGLGYGSMATQGIKVFINSNASGVQSYGVIGCSGLAAGDECYVTVYGTR